jgi:putative alpha-1,2-mannosidase
VIGAPLFARAEIKLDGGKKIVILANHNSSENRYIESASKDGKAFTETFLKHSELLKGAEIRFEMGKHPNTLRGVYDKDAPYSLSAEKN